jgi:hypothetical protein
MDHSSNFLSYQNQVNEGNKLSKISESLEKLQEEQHDTVQDDQPGRSKLNLSQMANAKNSNSISKTVSGASNIGSITIKLSSKEEELRTGSSKNRKFDDSEESLQTHRKRMINNQYQIHIQEQNENPATSQVNSRDYKEIDVWNNMSSNQYSNDFLVISSKKKKNVICSPVPELEEEKESRYQIDEELHEKKFLEDDKMKNIKIHKKRRKEEPTPKSRRVYRSIDQKETLNIAMTKSRSGRVRKPIKDKFSFLEPDAPKLNKNGEKKKSRIKNPFTCKCTKSNCINSYCICYKNGVLCTSKCKCRNCVFNSSNQIFADLYKKEKSINPLIYTERFKVVEAKIRKENGRIEDESKFLVIFD